MIVKLNPSNDCQANQIITLHSNTNSLHSFVKANDWKLNIKLEYHKIK